MQIRIKHKMSALQQFNFHLNQIKNLLIEAKPSLSPRVSSEGNVKTRKRARMARIESRRK